MEDNNVNDISLTYRDTSFSPKELNALLESISKHKGVFKLSDNANLDSENITWKKISKSYKRNGFSKIRSQDCLKRKFSSLKATAEQTLAHPDQLKKYEVEDALAQMINLIKEVKSDEDSVNDSQQMLCGNDAANNEDLVVRSPDFSVFENNALVDIVDNYRDIVLRKVHHPSAFDVKDKTWELITETYNKIGFPQNRTVDCLRNQFYKIKNQAVSVRKNVKYTQLENAVEKVVSMLNDLDNVEEYSAGKDKSFDVTYNPSENSDDDSTSPETEAEKDASNYNTKFRFSDKECLLLLKCAKAEKEFIFNKQYSNKTLLRKKRAWARITKAFNKQSGKNRSDKTLTEKFLNMKSRLKRDPEYRAYVIGLLNNHKEACSSEVIKKENNTNNDLNPYNHDQLFKNVHSDDNSQDEDVLFSLLNSNILEDSIEKERKEKHNQSDVKHESEDPVRRKVIHRSTNFTPDETSLLMNCVRAEKPYIFSTDFTIKGLTLKKRAWERIKQTFNNKSPRKRTLQCLRTKFHNMRSIAKTIGSESSQSFDRFDNDDSQEFTNPVKSEPMSFECKINGKATSDDNDDHEMFSDDHHDTNDRCLSPDPLSTVLNSDSGIDQYFTGSTKIEDKEVVKMQLELLSYQMETAKMERKRVEDAIKADIAAQEAKALETSLRVRAARLQALAAERMHPTGNPDLQFTTEELAARKYLDRYRN